MHMSIHHFCFIQLLHISDPHLTIIAYYSIQKYFVWISSRLQKNKGLIFSAVVQGESYTNLKGILYNYEGNPAQLRRGSYTNMKETQYNYKGDPIQIQRGSYTITKGIV